MAAPLGPGQGARRRRPRQRCERPSLPRSEHPAARHGAAGTDSGDPRWLSFKQATDKGLGVRKGERATTVFFFKTVFFFRKVQVAERAAEEGDGEARTVPVLRAYPVFHASQVEGIPA